MPTVVYSKPDSIRLLGLYKLDWRDWKPWNLIFYFRPGQQRDEKWEVDFIEISNIEMNF